MDFVNALVQGTLLGGVFAMSALGLSLAFGVLKVVNLAHGQLMALGGYFAVMTITSLGVNVWATLLVVIPAMFAIGYFVQRSMLQRALRMGELAPLMVTFGLSVIIPNALISFFSNDKKTIPIGDLAISSVTFAGISVGIMPLLTLGASVLLIAALQLFLVRTPVGRSMRAAADDPATLGLMGVDYRRVYASAMALAFALAALAGVFFGIRQGGVTPFDGQVTVLFAFEAVIIGGLGSLWGTLAGGIVLGIAQALAGLVGPEFPLLAGNLVFLLVLVLRPTGIVRSKVAS